MVSQLASVLGDRPLDKEHVSYWNRFSKQSNKVRWYHRVWHRQKDVQTKPVVANGLVALFIIVVPRVILLNEVASLTV